jgi:hypothetical protein
MPSSVVARMHYDAETAKLKVVFVSGLVYEYKDVPEEVFREFKTSGSKGTYLNKYIKGHYAYRKVS